MKYKLGILGLGKMGSSILYGIIKSGLYKKEEILLYDVNEETKIKFTKEGFTFSDSEQQLIDNIETLLIAIKPQMFKVLNELNTNNLNITVISIAAGKTIKNLQDIFGNQKFIRVMPNTPALISCGATAIARGENVDEETFSKVKQIFASIGVVEEIKEEKMNEIIPINGSMPAYLYYFVQAFIEQGVKDGIDYEVAKKLACEAVIGSAKMILETDKSIDELIKDVCSPGGATLEGLYVLENEKFKEIIYKASIACVKRAYELSE